MNRWIEFTIYRDRHQPWRWWKGKRFRLKNGYMITLFGWKLLYGFRDRIQL